MSSLRVLIIQTIIMILISTSCTTTTAMATATAAAAAATSPTATSTPKVTNTPYPTWDPKLEDTWLIGTEDCRPPCWHGIIPGETTYEEALKVFQSFGFTNSEGYIDPGEFDIGEDKTYIKWIRGDGKIATLYFQKNKVFFMLLSMLSGDLGSVVDHFGKPDGYTVFYDEGSYELEVFYPNHGLVFSAFSHRGEQLISEDFFVFNFRVIEPGEPNDFPTKYHEILLILNPRTRWYDYHQWEGFGINLSESD